MSCDRMHLATTLFGKTILALLVFFAVTPSAVAATYFLEGSISSPELNLSEDANGDSDVVNAISVHEAGSNNRVSGEFSGFSNAARQFGGSIGLEVIDLFQEQRRGFISGRWDGYFVRPTDSATDIPYRISNTRLFFEGGPFSQLILRLNASVSLPGQFGSLGGFREEMQIFGSLNDPVQPVGFGNSNGDQIISGTFTPITDFLGRVAGAEFIGDIVEDVIDVSAVPVGETFLLHYFWSVEMFTNTADGEMFGSLFDPLDPLGGFSFDTSALIEVEDPGVTPSPASLPGIVWLLISGFGALAAKIVRATR